jgi:hypothetical protein
VLVAYASNPGYPGGREQEDHGSKPVCKQFFETHILKNPSTKIGLVE